MAWCGVLLKVFDVGAKWAAIAIILQVFTGLPLTVGILISGGVCFPHLLHHRWALGGRSY